MWKYDAGAFCYMCGEFVKARDIKYELNKNVKLCEAYEAYFQYSIRNQDNGLRMSLKTIVKKL